MPNSDHFAWLVRARAENQQALLQLHEFGHQNVEALHCDVTSRSVFTLLVGTAFSLWRAAFLSDLKWTWSAIIGDANKLLERLVQDNAVAYPQDRDTREWMGRYYLNNAKWRLIRARDKLKAGGLDIAPEVVQQFQELDQIDIEQEQPAACWDKFHRAFEDLFKLLKKQMASKSS